MEHIRLEALVLNLDLVFLWFGNLPVGWPSWNDSRTERSCRLVLNLIVESLLQLIVGSRHVKLRLRLERVVLEARLLIRFKFEVRSWDHNL